MKFSIKLPFSEIVFENADVRHKEYFKDLFFDSDKQGTELKYKLILRFKDIDIGSGGVLYLEEDCLAKNGSLYLLDTKKNRLEINPKLFRKNNLVLSVEPDFDLYFLYNYIIEPLLIIWGAKHNVLYVHASAIAKKEGAHIFPAWRHTGKTSSIFSLVNESVKFMGDDFCVLYGSVVYLYPKYINIFSYNFESYPWLYSKLPLLLASRIKLSVYLKRMLFWVSQRMSGSLSKIFYRLSELAEISTNTKITPKQLGIPTKTSTELAKVIFITKASMASKKAKRLSSESMRQKLLSITLYEINDFMNIYQKYKYLYPQKGSDIIDSFEENYLSSVDINLENAYIRKIASLPNKDAYLNE